MTAPPPTPSVHAAYQPRRAPVSRFVALRGIAHHVLEWSDAPGTAAARPALVLLHGWMDIGASFQFVADALPDDRRVVAMDWRGFGLTTPAPATDSYWFADYLGDLDALLDVVSPQAPVDLVGHSMGGNVAMIYAGVRPERVRRLANLEGFGMPATVPSMAPSRYRQWLDELKAPALLRRYASLEEVAERLRRTNPLLPAEKAAWLATQWSRRQDDGQYALLADPAHRRINPMLYQVDEVLECWKRIEAPVLWVEGDRTDPDKWWGTRYPRSAFEERLAVVPTLRRARLAPASHMLHHDQPEALAALLEDFCSG